MSWASAHLRKAATRRPRSPARVAARALARRHWILQAILVPTAHRLMRYRTMHYEHLEEAEELGHGGRRRGPLEDNPSSGRGKA